MLIHTKKSNQLKRSKLHNRATIKWLHTRFSRATNQSRKNLSYMCEPIELKRERKIQQIFRDFDIDGSGGLSISQMYRAFNKYGVGIELEQVQQLYKIAKVKQFTMDSFKKFSLDEQSNAKFFDIIKKIDSRKHHDYLPHSFIRMFTFLVYKIKSD